MVWRACAGKKRTTGCQVRTDFHDARFSQPTAVKTERSILARGPDFNLRINGNNSKNIAKP